MPTNIPYLCGGILFDLLLQARKTRQKARNKLGGGSDGLSDTEIFKGLLYVVTGEEIETAGKTFAKATTQYKSCQISDSTYIPFKDASTISAFDSAVKNKNPDITNRMAEFISKYLNPEKYEWLVKALLDTIRQDDTISRFDEFNIDVHRKRDKSGISMTDYVYLPSFLVSILHFILTQRPNNEDGRATFLSWFSRNSEYSEWKFNSDIGSGIEQTIAVPNTYNEFISARFNGRTKTVYDVKQISRSLHYLSLDDRPYSQEGEAVFINYIEKIAGFYKKIKTLLYSEQPQKFYDFYVCNDLLIKGQYKHKNCELIPFAAINTLEEQSKNIIIEGTGGIGKSMMMKHLLFEGIQEYETQGRIPVLMFLKNFDINCSSISDFIWATVHEFDGSITQEQVREMLTEGKCILLFDGLDEISSVARPLFEKLMSAFVKRYPNNFCVISSRPTTSFISYSLFSIFEIQPFSKSKALELIDKLEFHNAEAKEKFREDLDKRLYQSHQQFASNPLLLTIMLMTYTSYGDIPAKRHIFYAKAYETMARLHDASKGAYVRPMHTKLSPEDFAVLFSEFCARTYKAELLEFTVESFSEYMNKVLDANKHLTQATAYEFLQDLTDNLCIIYKEGEKYYFIHRSFQEYFTAVYFSTQMDDKLKVIGDFFEHKKTRFWADRTFDMMYDMIPEKMDRYIFLPSLEALWKRCDEGHGYWTFLAELYPTIYSYCGEAGDFCENEPQSYLYNFTVNENLLRYNGELDNIDWPSEADGFKTDWASIEKYTYDAEGKRKVSYELCAIDEFPQEYIDECGEPVPEGSSWEIDTEIVRTSSKYSTLKAYLSMQLFPLVKEYKAMRKYTEELKEKMEEKHQSTDWFDNL